MNDCKFLGNLTRDPKLTPTKNNNYVATFGIATNRFYKRTDGETASEATYLEMEAWDTGAQRISEMFRKGDGILVEACAKNAVWTDVNGTEQKRIVFRISRFWPINKKHRPTNEETE